MQKVPHLQEEALGTFCPWHSLPTLPPFQCEVKVCAVLWRAGPSLGSAPSSCVPHKDLFPLWVREVPSLSSSSWTSMNGWWIDFQKMHQRLSRAARDFFYLPPPPLPFHRRDKLRPRSSKSFTLDPPVTKTQGLEFWHFSPQSDTPTGFKSELPR